MKRSTLFLALFVAFVTAQIIYGAATPVVPIATDTRAGIVKGGGVGIEIESDGTINATGETTAGISPETFAAYTSFGGGRVTQAQLSSAVGPAGQAATIAVGTVTTGAAGSSATVNNTGTSSAAVFDFSIPRGATGATGPTGPQGPTGATGPQGVAGGSMAWRGVWEELVEYYANDAVSYGTPASTYIAIGTSTGAAPDSSPAYWSLSAEHGATGATGATGPEGPQGPQGFQGYSGATGPQGPQGETGATGAQGPAGLDGGTLVFKGAWSAFTNYSTLDSVTYNGSSFAAKLPSLNLPPWIPPASPTTQQNDTWQMQAQRGSDGATGAQGPQGDTGPSGTTDHAALSNLDLEGSGHTGIVSTISFTSYSTARAAQIAAVKATADSALQPDGDGSGLTGITASQAGALPSASATICVSRTSSTYRTAWKYDSVRDFWLDFAPVGPNSITMFQRWALKNNIGPVSTGNLASAADTIIYTASTDTSNSPYVVAAAYNAVCTGPGEPFAACSGAGTASSGSIGNQFCTAPGVGTVNGVEDVALACCTGNKTGTCSPNSLTGYFTGGNHSTANTGSGSPNATSTVLTAKIDGISISDGQTLCGVRFDLVVQNLVQGENTEAIGGAQTSSNTDETQRPLIEETLNYTVTSKGVEINNSVRALEEINIFTNYAAVMYFGASWGSEVYWPKGQMDGYQTLASNRQSGVVSGYPGVASYRIRDTSNEVTGWMDVGGLATSGVDSLNSSGVDFTSRSFTHASSSKIYINSFNIGKYTSNGISSAVDKDEVLVFRYGYKFTPRDNEGDVNDAILATEKPANTVLAAPNGASGPLSARSLVAADIPSLNYEPVITSGTTSQYLRGDKSLATLNQSAVAGLTNADSPQFKIVDTVSQTQYVQGPSFQYSYADNNGAQVNLKKSGKSGGTGTSVLVAGEETGVINFKGYDGSTYAIGALIQSLTLDNFSASAHGASIRLMTVPYGIVSTSLQQVAEFRRDSASNTIFSLGDLSGGTATLQSTSHATKGLLTIANNVSITGTLNGATLPTSGTLATVAQALPQTTSATFDTAANAGASVASNSITITNVVAGRYFDFKLTGTGTVTVSTLTPTWVTGTPATLATKSWFACKGTGTNTADCVAIKENY